MTPMNEPSYQLILQLQNRDVSAAEILRNVLVSLDIDPTRVVLESRKDAQALSVYLDSALEADRLTAKLRRLKLRGVRISVKKRLAVDWAERWKEGWKPFPLTRRFCVIPLWQKSRVCPGGKEPIFLDTTNAFGTGLHETTRFSSQLIDQLAGRFTSFLDVGTGSGILAIVAGKLGVRDITAIDIDPEAVKVARENLKANRLPRVQVLAADIGNFSPQRTFGLVAANLVTWDLVAFRNKILPLVVPGGHLIVSGISLKNLPFFREHFRTTELQTRKLKKGKEWAAFLFRKRT
jgi:ribosomal protein L11 methyltransferase